MTVFGGVAYSLGLLCPLNGFAFPSVSLFWSVYNLEWINNLRSDYPLNSASAEWSYFERRGLVQSGRAPLALKPMLLIGLCAGVSRVAARESCPDYGIPVWVTAHARFDCVRSRTPKILFAVMCLTVGTVGHVCLGKSAALILHRFRR